MLAQEVIRRKRDGHALQRMEIEAFVRGLASGSWSEGQVASMAMAMLLKGMTHGETVALTQAMAASGSMMDWRAADLGGPVLDKHSTGGVGDKVSLLLAPIVAACGGCVPMVSGRGLGHTGGTLDKLESIPGYCVNPPASRVLQALQHAGCAIVGASSDLAPADRRLYAIRDNTATVESTALITASILSKKLAAGVQALVLDVKCGNGAFAATPAAAHELAQSLVSVAQGAGLPTRAWISDMNQVLGSTCGNALEVLEALDFLQGKRQEPYLLQLTRALCADLLQLGGLANSQEQALLQVDQALSGGHAWECFARMVHALGAAADFCERPRHYLECAPVQQPVLSVRAGWVRSMDTRGLGLLLIELGAGRRHAADRIDARVGLAQVAKLGQRVEVGSVLAVVNAADAESADHAAQAVHACFYISDLDSAQSALIPQRLGD